MVTGCTVAHSHRAADVHLLPCLGKRDRRTAEQKNRKSSRGAAAQKEREAAHEKAQAAAVEAEAEKAQYLAEAAEAAAKEGLQMGSLHNGEPSVLSPAPPVPRQVYIGLDAAGFALFGAFEDVGGTCHAPLHSLRWPHAELPG